MCKSGGSKCVECFFRLVDRKDNGRVGGGADLFPMHLADAQETVELGDVGVAEMLVWL